MEIDQLIGRKTIKCAGILEIRQNNLFAQAGLDQFNHILNSGREARRRLGAAIEGGHRRNQARHQAGHRDMLLQCNH